MTENANKMFTNPLLAEVVIPENCILTERSSSFYYYWYYNYYYLYYIIILLQLQLQLQQLLADYYRPWPLVDTQLSQVFVV